MQASEAPGHWDSGESVRRGFRQFYREWHPATERFLPVLALHGSLSQSGMWIRLAEALDGVRLLCPDQRGYARSATPDGDRCADFAQDALALAHERLPGRFVIMGHSFACSIALDVAIAARGRVAGVVLVDPVVRIAGATASRAPVVPEAESFPTAAAAERHFLESEEGSWTAEALSRFVRDIMVEDAGRWRFPYTGARLRRLRQFSASSDNDYDLFDKAALVRAPVLVFRGGMSRRFPAAAEEPFLAAFPVRPRLVVCPASGHFPTTTEPALVAAALAQYLAGLG